MVNQLREYQRLLLEQILKAQDAHTPMVVGLQRGRVSGVVDDCNFFPVTVQRSSYEQMVSRLVRVGRITPSPNVHYIDFVNDMIPDALPPNRIVSPDLFLTDEDRWLRYLRPYRGSKASLAASIQFAHIYNFGRRYGKRQPVFCEYLNHPLNSLVNHRDPYGNFPSPDHPPRRRVSLVFGCTHRRGTTNRWLANGHPWTKPPTLILVTKFLEPTMFRKLALLLALSVATPTLAEDFHYGAWTMTRQLDTNRNLMCLLHTYWPDKSFLYVKSFVNEPFLQVEISDPRWRLKAGTSVPVTLRFDAKPWNASTNVIAYEEDETFGLHSLVGNNELVEWLKRFALAKSMRIEFPNSREDPWKVNTKGSAAATSKFIDCIKDQEATAPPAANPFGDSTIEPDAEDDTRNPFVPARY